MLIDDDLLTGRFTFDDFRAARELYLTNLSVHTRNNDRDRIGAPGDGRRQAAVVLPPIADGRTTAHPSVSA